MTSIAGLHWASPVAQPADQPSFAVRSCDGTDAAVRFRFRLVLRVLKDGQAISMRLPISTKLHWQVGFKNCIPSKRPAEEGTQGKRASDQKAEYPLQFRPMALTHIRVAFCHIRIAPFRIRSVLCVALRYVRPQLDQDIPFSAKIPSRCASRRA